jgi:hypothetical protein
MCYLMGVSDPLDAPEAARMAELARAVREGRASEAEREELRLYEMANPDARALARRMDDEEQLGGDWLARTQADNRLAAAESTPYTKAERAVGVALAAGGIFGSIFFPPAGIVALAGVLVLTVSVLRVKLKTAGQDPYSKIEK